MQSHTVCLSGRRGLHLRNADIRLDDFAAARRCGVDGFVLLAIWTNGFGAIERKEQTAVGLSDDFERAENPEVGEPR